MERYHLIITFIMVEIIVIALFIMLAFGFYIAYKIRDKRSDIREKIIRQSLKKMIKNKQYQPLPYSKPIEAALSLLEIYDIQYHEDPFWQESVKKIMQTQLLPHARTYINKRGWFKKYLLLKCYRFYVTPDDEENILKLLEEQLPVLFINVANIASKCPSKKIFIRLIYRLSETQKPLANVTVMQLTPSSALHEALNEVLNNETNPLVRSICLLIIRSAGKSPYFYAQVNADTMSEDIELKTSAIRTLPFTCQDKALPRLIPFLKIEDWRIRNAVIKALGHIQSKEIIPYLITALQDPQWWVRINAARMLSLHSQDSREALATKGKSDPEVNKYADYFLAIYNIRQGKKDA